MSAIRLEPLSQLHVGLLDELVADPEVQRFTRIPSPPPEGFAGTWLERYREGRRTGTLAGFAILDEGGTPIGVAVVPRIDRDGRIAELGYMVAAGARGRGAATEALRLLSAWALAELGSQRLELLIDVDNEASKRVAARCGYRHEDTLRSMPVKEGVRRDSELWTRLRPDT